MKLRISPILLGLFFLLNINVQAQTATPPVGSGTEIEPYEIATIENLYWLTQNDTEWGKHYSQTADIDASDSENWEDEDGKGFKPIGESQNEFTGVYDGQGFEIKELTILERNGFSGMFGRAKDVIIMNIALVNVNIKADSPGGIVGYLNDGELSNSYVTGIIRGTEEVGGLTALNGGIITNSYVIADVSGGYSTGGLVGRNADTITNSYFSGQVQGTDEVGSVIGEEDWNSTISGLYWDANISDINNSIGTGLTSEEMRQEDYFTELDFSSVWEITEGSSYPNLQANTQSPAPGTSPFLINPDPFETGVNVTPTFTWSGVNETATYDIQVSTENDFLTTSLDQSGISDTLYAVTSNLSTGTTYYWRVRAVNSGIPEAWSRVNNFNITSFSTGSGIESDPFIVSTESDLNNVRENLNGHYKLSNDIDLSNATGDPSGSFWNDGKGFTPIGTEDVPFNGTFDGDGHVINGLYINYSDDEGAALFSIGTSGMVANLGLEDVDITAKSEVGGLAVYNEGTIKNSYTTGSVFTNGDDAGGLVAFLYEGVIDSSYSTVNVTADEEAGGLIGTSYGGEISNSYATGNVNGFESIGGLIGYDFESDLTNTFATGMVTGTYNIGGLIGEARYTIIQSSYASGSVFGVEEIGGFVGFKSLLTITNGYFNGTDDSGGDTGLSQLELRQEASFSGFDFTDTWAISEGSSYPYLQFSTPDPLPGIFPVLTSPENFQVNQTLNLMLDWEAFDGADSYDLQVATDYTFETMDIEQSGISATEYQLENVLDIGTQYFWRVRAEESGIKGDWSSFFTFTTTFYDVGDGTEANPFEIYSILQLDNIRADLSAHYELVSDIDLAFATGNSEGDFWDYGDGFEPIGDDNNRFKGSFDGNGYTLSGLHISRSASWSATPTGLFGVLDSTAKVLNIELLNVDIAGYSETGALAGINYGSITNIVASGTVEVQVYNPIGGITGRNIGVIEQSSFAGDVVGRSPVGGIVGRNDSTITESHSTADVDGYEYVGGLVGTNGEHLYSVETSASIAMSYATGQVSGAGYLGGLVGKSTGDIERSFGTGNIVGDGSSITEVGGFIGENEGTITDSYATGNITNVYSGIGGFVGKNGGTIIDSYSTGSPSGQNNTGGFSGNNSDTVTDSYWNTETSGYASSSAGTGLTSAEMRQTSSFIGFDFTNTWTIQEGVSFPYLQSIEPEVYPGYPVQQVSGKSLSFNSGRVEVPHKAFYDDLEALTLEAWVNLNSPKLNGIIEKFSSNSGFWLRVDAGNKIEFAVHPSGESGSKIARSETEVVSTDTWHHLAAVYDGTDSKLYLDGVDVTDNVSSTNTGSIRNNSREIGIGDLNWTSGALDGNIDEVKIWNTARSGEQIQQNMFQKLNGDETGLLTYLPFDETEGEITLDKTANENFATLDEGVAQIDETHPYGTFITGSEGWRMMSSPFGNESYGVILDTLWTQGFPGSDSPDYGSSNVYFWDEATSAFTSIADAADIPTAGTGFITYVYDDDDFDETPDGFPKELRVENTQNSGSVTPTLSFTDTEDEANDGWNLLGNPYGATIDWDTGSGWTTENLDAAFYVWNADAGEYQSWNGTTGTLTNGLIAPWQGFWVKANGAEPLINLNDEVRSAGGTFRKEKPTPSISFELAGENKTSSAVIMLSKEARTGKDKWDAYKLASLNSEYLSLFTQLEDGSALDINALPSELEEVVYVDLEMDGAVMNVDFELSWDLQALPDDWQFVLKDNITGEEVDLRESSTLSFQPSANKQAAETREKYALKNPMHHVMSPEVVKAKSTSAPRFTLIVSSTQVVSNEQQKDVPDRVELQQNYPNPFNPVTTIAYGVPEAGEVSLEVFDLLGRKVATLINREFIKAGRHNIKFDARSLASGLYLYRLNVGKTVITKKLTLIK